MQSFQVYRQGGCFLIFFAIRFVTAIDVNDVQGFGVFYDQVSTGFEVHRLSEGGLDKFSMP